VVKQELAQLEIDAAAVVRKVKREVQRRALLPVAQVGVGSVLEQHLKVRLSVWLSEVRLGKVR